MPAKAEAEYLAHIRDFYEGREASQEKLIDWIKIARRAGISWAKIGQAMDMTYQGARQRYLRYTEEAEFSEAADA